MSDDVSAKTVSFSVKPEYVKKLANGEYEITFSGDVAETLAFEISHALSYAMRTVE